MKELWDSDLFDDVDDKNTYRNFVFTSFNEQPPEFSDSMIRLMYATETCPTTGKKHYQGYVSWTSGKSIKSSYKHLGKVWCKPAKADFQASWDYIHGPYNKDGKHKPENPTFVMHGDPPAPGGRSDLKRVADLISSGDQTVDDVLENDKHMFHLYERTLNRIEDLRLEKMRRTWRTEVCWFYGANCGSTWDIPYNPAAYVHGHTHWWDRYKLQEIVQFQNFTQDMASKNVLKSLMGSADLRLPRRYRACVPFMAKEVDIYCSEGPWKYIGDDEWERSNFLNNPCFHLYARNGNTFEEIDKKKYYSEMMNS